MRLYRKRGVWFNEEVLSKTVNHIIKYDALKKQYRVSDQWAGFQHKGDQTRAHHGTLDKRY